jgi:lipoprotein-anchoring transpeptidase ErfK/SrfK
MRHLTAALGLSLLAGLAGLPAHADTGVGLRLSDVAVDKPIVTVALRTVPGAKALALVQDGMVLQRYAPPANSPEGLVPVSLQPGTGAISLTARAYGPEGQILGESPPLQLDPQAFAPEPLSLAADADRVDVTMPAVTIASLTPAVTDDGLPGATVTVTLNGQQVHRAFLPRHGHLALPRLPLALGKNELRIEQSNAWGRREIQPVRAYNLGESIGYSTYALVDKENYSLYWVRDGKLKGIYPIATGRPRTPTPVGTYVMGKKEIMPHPHTGWGVMRLLIYDLSRNGRRHWGGYAIHGTDQPSSIGKEASHGCVRMFNEDILKRSSEMPLETRVIIRAQLPVYIDEL